MPDTKKPAAPQLNSTFDRAVNRMRNQGFRPFCPDGDTRGSVRWMRHNGTLDNPACGRSERMDALIAAFCAGVLAGILIP
jgi:hypothetical protein